MIKRILFYSIVLVLWGLLLDALVKGEELNSGKTSHNIEKEISEINNLN